MSGSQYNFLATPTVVNPAAALSNATQIAGQMNALQAFRAKQAAGNAFLGSINPDGTTNQTALLSALKADPTTALAAPEAAQAGQTLSADEQGQRYTRLQYGASLMAPLLAKHPDGNVPYDEIKQAWDQAVADKHVSSADEQASLSAFSPSNGVQNYQSILQRLSGNISSQEAIRAAKPATDLVTTPQGVIPIQRPPVLAPNGANQGNVQVARGGVAYGVDPQTASELKPVVVPVTDANGTTTYISGSRPRSAMPGMVTGTPVPGATAPGGVGSPPPTPPGPGTTIPMAYTPRPAAGGGNTAAVSGPASSTPTDFVQTAPPQGQPDRLAAGNKMQADAAAALPDQQKRLIAGESALEALNLARTGPGTGTVNQLAAWLNARGEDTSGVDLNSTGAYQILQKQLLRFSQDSAKRGGTDLGLETQLHSNANTETMLNSANRHVLVQDIGLLRRDMVQSQTMPTGEAAFDHVKNFAANTDPRAFAWDIYSPAERNQIVESAKKDGSYDKLRSSLLLALQSGRVRPPAQGQAAPVAPALSPAAPAAPANLLAPRVPVSE